MISRIAEFDNIEDNDHDVITCDKTITLGDGLPWYYRPFINMLIDCELQESDDKEEEI